MPPDFRDVDAREVGGGGAEVLVEIAAVDVGVHAAHRVDQVDEPVEVDVDALPLAAGDLLLLCSDGLWEMVRDQQIAAILTTPMPHPAETAYALVQAALAGGGEDNVSVIVVHVAEIA